MMADSWQMHSRHLDSAVLMATQELFTAVDARPNMSPRAFQAVCAGITEKYGKVAVSSALWALEDSRHTSGHDRLPSPVAVDPVNIEQVTHSASYANNRAEGAAVTAARLYAGSLGRLVRQPARDTIWESTSAAGTGYVRVPAAGACSFCLMLGSRGAVYTQASATVTGTTRRRGPARESHYRNPSATGGHRYSSGQRQEGRAFHDHCNCRVQESHSYDDLPTIVTDLQKQWYEITYTADGHMKPNQKKAWDDHWAAVRAEQSA